MKIYKRLYFTCKNIEYNLITSAFTVDFPYPLRVFKIRNGAKTRNRYNQAPHLTQDTYGKVTTLQLDITNESQEVSPFPAGDHKAPKTDVHEGITKQDRNNINDQHNKHRLETVSNFFLLEGKRYNGQKHKMLVFICLI